MPTLLTVAPYRVWPPASGAALLIDGASRAVAKRGWSVRLFTSGVRRGSLWADLGTAEHEVGPGYTVCNHASLRTVLRNRASRQATGLPPLGADRVLEGLRVPRLEAWLREADVVQVEGPYGFAAMRAKVAGRAPLVLVCHNVEGRLAAATLAHRPDVARNVAALEGAAAAGADALIALTDADRDALVADYGVAPARVHVVPCGVDLERFSPASPAERERAKDRLGLAGRTVAVFTGARYGPNVEAARRLERMAADAAGNLPDELIFLVVGRVGEALGGGPRLRLTGYVPNVSAYLAAADLAVVPMQSGGGMHLKVLEFLACGLPVVATPLALRGLEAPLPEGVTACAPDATLEALTAWAGDGERRARAGAANRAWVAERYGWDRIGALRTAVYEDLRGGGARA